MKIEDVLTQGEIKNKTLKKAMKGGKTEKKVAIEGNKIFGKGFHAGYSYKVDSSDRDQYPQYDV